MPLPVKIILIVLGVILLIFVVLIIVGRKMQKKQAQSQASIEAASQVMSMLIIDKKRMKLRDANLPKVVMEQVPKYMQEEKSTRFRRRKKVSGKNLPKRPLRHRQHLTKLTREKPKRKRQNKAGGDYHSTDY